MSTLYTIDFQKSIIKLLCSNVKFVHEYGTLLKDEYFESQPLRILFNIINTYVLTYEKEVSEGDLLVLADEYVLSKGYSSDVFSMLKSEIKEVGKVYIKSEQFIIDQLIKYCKRQELKNAILKSVDILEKDGSSEEVLKLIDNANSIGFGGNEGLAFSDMLNFPNLYKTKYNPTKLVRTGFNRYDQALGGGYAPGELHILQAPPKCLTSNTLIKLLNGTSIAIKDLVGKEEFWVYSCEENGGIVPGRGHTCKLAKETKEIYQITLDNNEILECDNDHLWMMRDGTYRRADELKQDDSLMPLYFSYNEKGYEYIKHNNNNGKVQSTHQMVARNNVPGLKECWGDIKENDKPDKHLVVHHKDFNKRNNDPSNLQWMGENYETERLSSRSKYNGCGGWKIYNENNPLFNHKIKSVKVIKYDEPQQLYCFKVDKYHNFAVDLGDGSGVFSHNTGKSTIACNIGVNVLAWGKSVYHITNELKEIDIMAKYATRITGLSYAEIMSCSDEQYKERISKFIKYKPNLFVNYWTEKTLNAMTIRSWISRKRSMTGINPDLIIIDNDDGMVPVAGHTGDMYDDAGEIYGDFIGLADYFQCFTGDTLIPLANGEIKRLDCIKPEEEVYIYSLDNDGRTTIERAVGLPPIGKVEDLIEITLDNNKIIKCTPDHKFLCRDGLWKEAKDLIETESLMPIYRIEENGYELCKSGVEDKFSKTHNIVANKNRKQKLDVRSKTKDDFLVVHHKDFNKRNNDPSNLQWMGEHDHWTYHSKLQSDRLIEQWKDPKYRKKMTNLNIDNAIKQKQDPKFMDSVSKAASKVMHKLNADPVFHKNLVDRLKMEHATGLRKAFGDYLGSLKNKEIGKTQIKRLLSYVDDPIMKDKVRLGIKKSWENDIKRREATSISTTLLCKKNWSSDKFRQDHTDIMKRTWENPLRFIKPKIINLGLKVINSGLPLTKDNYENIRNRAPSWERALEIFGSEQEIIRSVTNNHKIIKIRKIKSVEKVYCLNVPTTNNFLLDAGVVVSNCPVLTLAQPKREAWEKANRGELIYSYDLAHSARKAHKCFSISSVNFQDDQNEGILYVDLVRRGESSVKVKIRKDLSRSLFQEIDGDGTK